MKHDNEDSTEAMIQGALPLMWLIMIGFSMAKLLPLGLDASFTNLLPGWFGIISSSVLLAVITLVTGLPNARQTLAGVAAAIVGGTGVLALAATGKFWILALGFILLVLPASSLVFRAVRSGQDRQAG